MKTLVLIDGHSLAYRVYFALERTGMSTSKKEPIWAVYGFFNALFSLLKQLEPDGMIVSFDVSRESFRNKLYPDYKANRESMPDAMRSQMSLIREGVEKLGIPIYEKKDFEADDLIGTLSKMAVAEDFKVQILTGDQDAFQLVDDGKVEILIPSRSTKEGLKTYTREEVYKKMGVYPEQVIDFKGLKGDTSDNIPGVPGVGDKTAAKLLGEYGTLERVYENIEQFPKNKLREKLETYHEQAILSKTLATIDRDVPLSFEPGDAHFGGFDVKVFMEFLKTCEFKNFIKQAPDLLKPFLNGNSEEALRYLQTLQLSEQASGNEGQGSLFSASHSKEADSAQLIPTLTVPHELILDQGALTGCIKTLEKVGTFAIDIETTGLDVLSDDIVGIAISYINPDQPFSFQLKTRNAANLLNLAAYPDSFQTLELSDVNKAFDESWIQTAYIPLRHDGLDQQLSEDQALKLLKPIFENQDIVKIVHNAKFELNVFKRLGVPLNGLVFDTMIASYVVQPERRHGLKFLGFEVLGHTMREFTDVAGKGKKMIPFGQVPIDEASMYAAGDTYITLALAVHFLKQFDEAQKTLFYEIEMPLAHVLAEMESLGVRIDPPCLETLSQTLNKDLDVLEKEIYTLAGCEFNLNSPKQVGEVFFEKLAIPPLRKTATKSGYSTDAKVLEKLAEEHDIAQKLLDYRQLFKLKSTYIDNLPTLVHPKTKRIHTSFNQTVAATGRLSSSDPNLQNIPIRSEVGRQIRQAFVPPDQDHWKLLSADYSQIELRLLAHFSEDPNLIKAFQDGEDIHRATAALVFGLSKDEVTDEQRYRAKAVNFGIIYGQTAYGLSQQLKIPYGEAQEFIDRYFKQYPKVQDFIESVKDEAKKTGRVSTLCGRVRDLTEGLNSSVKSVREFSERAAFNTPLQGSAADLIKVAMIRVARTLKEKQFQSQLILQVHDEVVLEVPIDELADVIDAVVWSMELAQPLKVPLVVDVNAGASWIDAK